MKQWNNETMKEKLWHNQLVRLFNGSFLTPFRYYGIMVESISRITYAAKK